MKQALVQFKWQHAARYRVICVLLASIALASGTQAQERGRATNEEEAAPVVASKEYFVRQQAGETLVVRVSAFEAAFTSVLATETGEVLAVSGLPDARMLPIWQYVAEPAAPRQIDIDVTASEVTDRSEFELITTRLNIRDNRTANLATAYRLLASGLELVPGASVPDWTVKVQTLMQSSALFEEQGMQEMRLWARAYAAHLILHLLRDPLTAQGWADEILATPRIERYPQIHFTALKVRSSAMANAESAGGTGAGDIDPENSELQVALADTAQAASTLGYRFEEAKALQAAGIDLKQYEQYAPALMRLENALEIAKEIGAADLAAEIREHIVEIHDKAGDPESSGSVLQDIESHLVESGESEELARNLLQQGRLYLEGHRYNDAVAVLSRAIGLEQSSLTRIEVDLALGTALNEAGRSREALAYLERAVTQPATRDYRQPSAVLDIESALGQMAGIHRQLGQFERMEAIRAAQGEYARGGEAHARFVYELAVDALWRDGPHSQITADRFRTAYRQASDVEAGGWRGLSLLHLCALPDPRVGDATVCVPDATRQAFDVARSTGIRRQSAEAALSYAGVLAARGQSERALAVADELMGELLTTGTRPLGSWYWQWREALFQGYMELAIAAEDGDASRSLLALSKARAVDRRARVAPAPDHTGLQDFLGGLPAGAAVLTWYLGSGTAQAWVADPRGVRRFPLEGAERILAMCAEVRDLIQSGALRNFLGPADRLGAALVAPLIDALPDSLLVVAHGALVGVPIDALVLDGQPLAARFEVAYLDDFPASGSADRWQQPFPASVFLAGDPRDWTGEYADRLDASPEFRALTQRFVGPGLHAVQGVSLLADEFADARYGESELVHLSIPGIVELSPGRPSTLFLSEPARGKGREPLDATALGRMPLNAGLVFFSRTEFSGTGSILENHLGVVSAVLDAGAGAAIATLWPVADDSRSRIVSGFYDHLGESANLVAALAQAKRDSMRDGDALDWASFQLFLN